MHLIQLILRPFSLTYFIFIRKSFCLINGIVNELLNASHFWEEQNILWEYSQFVFIWTILCLKSQQIQSSILIGVTKEF